MADDKPNDDKTVVASSTQSLTGSQNRSASPVLLQYDGGAAGKRFMLQNPVVLLGRRADKVQVWIDFMGSKAVVTDLGSLNHTFVNDVRVMQSAELAHGDMLRVGNVRLRYFTHGSADQLLFDRIYRMAVQDRMLDVFRREYAMERLEEEFRHVRTSQTELSFIMLDLDRFKAVNDTYGHDAGDIVLKDVCAAIKPLLGSADTLARFGGEEFCVLTSSPLHDAVALAERIRRAVELISIEYEGHAIPVTVSLGVANANEKSGGELLANAQELIRLADSRLYQSKQGGRNRVTAA
ncbi:MAG: GGDEF domain-containing protein [Proteobacteria bacterium]|nr:GGDEF domain-containing protein [Pseudomonadota bacterium]